jgi:hypothetical protein
MTAQSAWTKAWRRGQQRKGCCARCRRRAWLGTTLCRAHLLSERLRVRRVSKSQPYRPHTKSGGTLPAEVRAGLSRRGFQ